MGSHTDRFPLVDALRAVAALAVLGTHAAYFAGAAAPGSDVGRYAQRLDVGVAVFFLISGFVLYRPFVLRRTRGEAAPSAGRYAWRRVLRLVPAYWIALTVSALWLGTSGVFTAEGALTFYGYGQTYREATIGGGLTQAWTLCIEVAFSVFVPLWAFAVRRARPRTEALGLAGLVAVSVAWKVVVLGAGSAEQVRITPLLLALPAYLDQFALGMGLAVLTVWLQGRPSPPAWLRAFDRAPSLSWGVALIAFWAVSTRIGIGDRPFEPVTPAQYLARHALYTVVAVGLLLPAVIGTPGRGWVRRLLATRVLGWLGLISYGIYLWHLTGLALLDRWGFGSLPVPALVAWPVAGLALAVAFAAASYYGVERPLLRLRDARPGRRTRRRGRVPA